MKTNFSLSKNIILACHISGVYDVNRSATLQNDDFSIVSAWAKSIKDLGLQGILFHNNFSESTCLTQENEHLHFIKVDYNPSFKPNVFRYFVYNEFLKLYTNEIENLFCTDVSDVVVLKNPFKEPLFIENPEAVFCGNEPEILENEWMKNHSEHLRNKIKDYPIFEANFKNETLLNCGVFGGKITVIKEFINQLWTIHQNYNFDNNSLFTGDMGAFNYLIRTKYNSRIIHGKPVNTEFKKYDDSEICWFKHK